MPGKGNPGDLQSHGEDGVGRLAGPAAHPKAPSGA